MPKPVVVNSSPPQIPITTEVPIEPIVPPVEDEAPVDDLIEATTNDEVDLSETVIKAYRRGMKDGRKKYEKIETKKTVTSRFERQTPCFWCGWDGDCRTCTAERRARDRSELDR